MTYITNHCDRRLEMRNGPGSLENIPVTAQCHASCWVRRVRFIPRTGDPDVQNTRRGRNSSAFMEVSGVRGRTATVSTSGYFVLACVSDSSWPARIPDVRFP